jgi:beta-galactosidase GanA
MHNTIRAPCQLNKTAAGGWQLIRHGEPFLVLGGELHNSSSSSAGYMHTLYHGLKSQGFNTLLAGVSWEDIEPEEGRFDFTDLNTIVKDCRASGLLLILLWFGSFKNGKS